MPSEIDEARLETTAAESPAIAAPLASSAPLSPARSNMSMVISLCLVALTFVLYEPSLHDAFVNFDDPGYISQNAHVAQGLTWDNIRWAFTTTQESNWHPVTWISLM